MKRTGILLLLSLAILLSGCNGKISERSTGNNTALEKSSSSDTDPSIGAAISAEEWIEMSDFILPEALAANAYVSFDFTKQKLSARYIFNFDQEIESFRFSLSRLAAITNADAPGGASFRINSTRQTQWGGSVRDYEVTFNVPANVAEIEYTSAVDGWCNIIEEQRVALSPLYSAWAIYDLSVPVKVTFLLEGLEDYFVLKSDYDPESKLWTYRQGFDFANIIAFKNGSYKKFNEGVFNFYYLSDQELDVYGEIFASHYGPIVTYCESIFPKIELSDLDFAVLELDNKEGWRSLYSRKGLVVMDYMDSPDSGNSDWITDDSLAHLLAHEMAHNWFSGADTNTWEDWLNETGAEWAAMLYMLNSGGDEVFQNYVSDSMEVSKWTGTKPIKTSDGSHPGDAHYMGTYLFSELYLSRGLDAVMEVLQTLAEVMAASEPTTEKFINALRIKMGDDIPDRIVRGLELTDYTGLFEQHAG